jgi:hypothetical protein
MSFAESVRRGRLSHVPPAVAGIALLLMPLASAQAGPRWVLINYRQIGNVENANNLTIENHLFREDGSKGAFVGVTNASNALTNIFGNTDIDGWNRINPLDTNHCAYDIQIYNPPTPTDPSPQFYFQNPPLGRFYSFVTQWMYVSEDSVVTAFPNTPVYRYDQVDGINQAGGFSGNCTPSFFIEPNGTQSDAKTLIGGAYTTYQAQTFVVPEGINRIVSAQIFVTRGAGDPKFRYRASIRQNSPTGSQIGPWVTSREINNGEFKEAAVNWGINDVPVTPGQTYALRAEATDGAGFNAWVTTQDNYPNGQWYHGATAEPGRDMFAIVVGVNYDATPPTIVRSPSSFNRSVVQGSNPTSNVFTVANSGGGVMSYSITDNASWLSVTPTGGTATTETDNITINYTASLLTSGPYDATITITAPGATNTPQTISVHLDVTAPQFVPCDFDQDTDVDLKDYGQFQFCMTPIGVAQNDPNCAGAKLDGDEDVDPDDLARFLQCLSGANVPVTDTLCYE